MTPKPIRPCSEQLYSTRAACKAPFLNRTQQERWSDPLSYMATARDFARFGELYLNDGARNGVQVLPKGWVTYSATPAPAAPQGCYGVQVWLNKGSPDSAVCGNLSTVLPSASARPKTPEFP